MIRICRNCSSVLIGKVKELAGADNVQVACIGRCGTPYAALINREAVICNSEEELYEEIKKRI